MEEEPGHRYLFDKEFHEIVSNKEILRRTTEKFINNLIDEITLGIIFDTHRKFKTRAFNLDRDTSPTQTEDPPTNVDIFGQHNMKKTQECVCPNCDRAVAAPRYSFDFFFSKYICFLLIRQVRTASRKLYGNG